MGFTQITLELPDELLGRVDHQVERIRQHDLLVSRGNVIAMLLGTALDDTEGKLRPGGRHPALRRLTSPVNQLLQALEAQRVETAKKRRIQAEESSPRLRDLIPSLRELSLKLVRRMGQDIERRDAHTRHVVIDRAPAYFFTPCLDHDCVGGHDFTGELIEGLRQARTSIVATTPCDGGSVSAECAGMLELEATARYEAGSTG